MNNIKKVLLFLFMWSNLFGVKMHIIYVSGPPLEKNKDWFKESKVIYAGIKKKVNLEDNTVELFPKKNYRNELGKRRRSKHSLSKRELLSKYDDIDKLLKELTDLIIKRRDEILLKNNAVNDFLDEENLDTVDDDIYWEDNAWDTHIHLRSSGLGSELLYMLNSGVYRALLGTLVTFDGKKYESSETDDDFGNTIINITVNQVSDISDEYWDPSSGCKGCNSKKFFGTVGLILGTVGTIITLL